MDFEETRAQQYASAVKQGGFKEAIDISVRKVSKPMTKALAPVVGKMTDSNMSDPIVRAGLEFAVMQAVAEVFFASSHVAHKIPGLGLDEDEAAERMEALSRFMRAYSGERVTDEVAQYAVSYLPVVKKLISDASLAGIFSKKEKAKSLPPASRMPTLWEKLEEEIDEEGSS